MSFVVVIPARYASSRLSAKLLKDIHGKPLIQHTFENAINSKAEQVIIATDDERIETTAQAFGATTCMTHQQHNSGTSRIAEVIEKFSISEDTVIVNVQGDEPMINPKVIDQVASNLVTCDLPMATLCEKIKDKEQYLDPNCVKVVFNKLGRALYFSRAPIPAFRDEEPNLDICFKHIGIYAYRAGFVKQYLQINSSEIELAEKLEQLSVLSEGFDIHVAEACASIGFGVDTQNDLDKVRKALSKS